jgi:hypothetical protein
MRWTWLVVLCAGLCASTASRADGNPAAEELFRAGKESMAKGDVARACALFAESLRHEAAAGTQLNLADCEQRSGHLARALGLFEAGRAHLPPGDFRAPFADERIAALSKQVPDVILSVRGAPPAGVRFFCDGEEMPAGVATRVDTGGHILVVRAPSRSEQKIEFVLGAGEHRVLEVDMRGAEGDARSSSGLSSAPEAPASHSGRPAAAYVAGSIGIVGLAVGAITGIMTMQAANTYKGHCNAGQCDSTGLDAASTGRTLQVVSPIGFAVGAVGIGAGAWLWFSSPSPSAARAYVAPAVGPKTAGVSLGGVF